MKSTRSSALSGLMDYFKKSAEFSLVLSTIIGRALDIPTSKRTGVADSIFTIEELSAAEQSINKNHIQLELGAIFLLAHYCQNKNFEKLITSNLNTEEVSAREKNMDLILREIGPMFTEIKMMDGYKSFNDDFEHCLKVLKQWN